MTDRSESAPPEGGLLIKGTIVASLAALLGLIVFAPRGGEAEAISGEGGGSPPAATPSTARDLESFPVFRTPRERVPRLREDEPDYPDLDAEGNEIPRGTPAL